MNLQWVNKMCMYMYVFNKFYVINASHIVYLYSMNKDRQLTGNKVTVLYLENISLHVLIELSTRANDKLQVLTKTINEIIILYRTFTS